ncbi:hypothetical protein [Alienimonas sp. DA493]|uniref:hypothetical protein n=1 Tax=Alienimonas sp. DA493 TaxID=3373605 RepID=UPI003754F6EA
MSTTTEPRDLPGADFARCGIAAGCPADSICRRALPPTDSERQVWIYPLEVPLYAPQNCQSFVPRLEREGADRG